MRRILWILLLMLPAVSFAQRVDDGAVQYRRGHLRDASTGRVLSDDEVLSRIGETVYEETYAGARKQYKAGAGLFIAGGIVTGTGLILCNRAMSNIKSAGWSTLRAALKGREELGNTLDQNAEDVTWSIVTYFGGTALEGIGIVLLQVGVPLFTVGAKRLEWVADDYNERRAPALTFTAGPASIGLRYSF